MKIFLIACILFSGCVRRVVEPQQNPPQLPPEIQYIYDLSRPHWLHDSPVYITARRLEENHKILNESSQQSRTTDDPFPIVLGETPEPDMYQFLDVTWSLKPEDRSKIIKGRTNINIRIAFTLKPRDAMFAVEEFNALKKLSREWVIGDDIRFVLGFPEQHREESGSPDPKPGISKFFKDYMHEEFTIIALRVIWKFETDDLRSVAEAMAKIDRAQEVNEFNFFVPY